MRFDTKSKTWKEIAKMSKRRAALASAVHEGRVVVSRGTDIDSGGSKTFEAYDHVHDQQCQV